MNPPQKQFPISYLNHLRCLTTLAAWFWCSSVFAADGWQSLFNGKDLTGWRANAYPESFTVENGAIRANATTESSHLFYVGDLKEGAVRFKNFEFEATVRSEKESNSGIYFHSDINSGKGPQLHLSKGYEVQLNNQTREKKKTGSLYAIVDLDKSPVDETQWFKIRFRVENKRITIWVNDRQTVDYTEPEDVQRPPGFAGRLLDPQGGAIALQGHDPKSFYWFKDIRIRRLP